MSGMRERFTAVTADLLRRDPRVALVLADIGVRAFADAGVDASHAGRVVNVGIREQLMIGVAAGMALEGLRPFVHSYAPFLVERPYEQIKLDLGHQDVGAVLVSIGGSYDAASEGRTHQCPADVALLSALPGWRVDVPGHPDEVEAFLRAAAAGDDRRYVRLEGATNRRSHDVAPGRLLPVRSVALPRAVVVAVGPLLDPVLEATAELPVTVLYAATVRPFDRAGLRGALAGAADVVLVEPYLAGTSAGEVAAALADVPHRVLPLGVPNVEHRRYGTPAEHRAAHGLDAAGLTRSIAALVRGPAARDRVPSAAWAGSRRSG